MTTGRGSAVRLTAVVGSELGPDGRTGSSRGGAGWTGAARLDGAGGWKPRAGVGTVRIGMSVTESRGDAEFAAGLVIARVPFARRGSRTSRPCLILPPGVSPPRRFAGRRGLAAGSGLTWTPLTAPADSWSLAGSLAEILGMGSVVGSWSWTTTSTRAASTAACMRRRTASGSTGATDEPGPARAAPGTRRRSGRPSSSI